MDNIENPMVNDAYWPEEDEDKTETPWEKFCRKADEEYDSRGDM